MSAEPGLRAEILPDITGIPAEQWTACFPREAEGWAYYRAVGGRFAVVRDAGGLVMAAPLFTMEYRLDTPFQGTAAAAVQAVARRLPGLFTWRLLGVGSALAERCHVAVRPGLDPAALDRALDAFLALLEAEAAATRARLLAFKDLAAPETMRLAVALSARGYVGLRSLPVAVLELTGQDEGAYLARLSAGTRKDLRRKLKARAALRIEHRDRIDDVADRIEALYASTRDHSAVRYGDFEDLPAGYFRAVAAALDGRARFVLYWIGGELAAFNLLFLEPDRIIDKFLGMTYPLGPEHNIYAVSWMENVRFALQTGRRLLQSGQTAYASKLRFGSSLMPSGIFVRSRLRLLNPVLRTAAPWLHFDRWDPDLGRDRAA